MIGYAFNRLIANPCFVDVRILDPFSVGMFLITRLKHPSGYDKPKGDRSNSDSEHFPSPSYHFGFLFHLIKKLLVFDLFL